MFSVDGRASVLMPAGKHAPTYSLSPPLTPSSPNARGRMQPGVCWPLVVGTWGLFPVPVTLS